MISVFDVYSISLLLLSLVVFVVRYVRQDPPIMPYLVIACVCAVGNWLGDLGGGWAAMSLLVAASFLFLSLLLAPYGSKLMKSRAGQTEQPDSSQAA
jgi:energy-coupling factor transporter transmembrane protein EcfT